MRRVPTIPLTAFTMTDDHPLLARGRQVPVDYLPLTRAGSCVVERIDGIVKPS
jgi:hypothetical protein